MATHSSHLFLRPMPEGLEGLTELALDLRWTWSHYSDRLWESLDAEAWERTGNPYYILESVSQARLEQLAGNPAFRAELEEWLASRRRYLDEPGWFGRHPAAAELAGVVYFSLEFGLSEALPLYSGGLGILAGDALKAASDLGLPVAGVGLLYQQGYFRQMLAPDGRQLEAFPYNDPTSLPVTPVRDREGGWLRLRLALPGRSLFLRVWEARVGKATLYLLDSNDPLNNPPDRGLTAHLYPAEPRLRLAQEIILGVGGWAVVEALGLAADVCHLNEGHAAFVVLARALAFMRRTGRPFPVALWATRAGNVFTTHTPVEAAFDRFEPALIRPYAESLAPPLGLRVEELLALGRRDSGNEREPFNMAFLAMRGCWSANGVSRLHGGVSRRIFQPLFPDWPEREVPVGHVTNGVHVPSWDSREADEFWTRLCGKGRWIEVQDEFCEIEGVPDEDLWAFRAAQRLALVRYVRGRLVRQLREHGAPAERIAAAERVFDPDVLTLGFARRFVAYKRPTLLLDDPARLKRLLCDPWRPVQLVVAGKAHPNDEEGKRLLQALARFAADSDLCGRLVFLEDYDMVEAQALVAGIDVWLNTPRRPWEACGTSGMKVLVNGGLNLSELDGWWAEAYAPEVGWALGDGREHEEPDWDAREARQLYELLEKEVVPAFYERDRAGLPQAWLRRIRASMGRLTPRFSGNRMLREYLELAYLPAAAAHRRRTAEGAGLAVELHAWRTRLVEGWRSLRFGELRATREGDHWRFEVQVWCGGVDPDAVAVELYADPIGEEAPTRVRLDRKATIPGSVNGYGYVGEAPAARPAGHYTPRIVPAHPEARVPLELPLILWRR